MAERQGDVQATDDCPDQEQPGRSVSLRDASARRKLPTRIVRWALLAALVGAVLGAVVGDLIDGAGLAVGLAVAFALVLAVISGLVPNLDEDGTVDDAVQRHRESR
ncbi:MAG: hypothetical protein HYX33_02630 [Actinobacteria bacterium]|nr:hypothetical protein [Actinomycetota bacterium]